MGILPEKKNNSYSIALFWITQSDSRLGELEHVNHEHKQMRLVPKIFAQLNSLLGLLEIIGLRTD